MNIEAENNAIQMVETIEGQSQQVDLSRIKQKKVKKFIKDFGLYSFYDFSKMKPVCCGSMVGKYKEHLETFIIKQNSAEVWKAYKTINHTDAWRGSMVSFGVQFSRNTRSFNYADDQYPGMQSGQIIILNLKFLFGLLNIAVAHEISEMNEDEMSVKLCYMENGVTEGSQWISLKETQEGFTQVVHKTLYRSKSSFRDSALYPRLHSKAIKEFHDSVKRKAEAKS
jgi:hypothetical protein